MIGLIIGILGGILCLASLIAKKQPNATEWINKIAPYQGWIGIVLLIWGVFDLFQISTVLSYGNILVIIFWASMTASEIICGFLLSFGLIIHYTSKDNSTPNEKANRIKNKLANYQILFGTLLIITELIYFIL